MTPKTLIIAAAIVLNFSIAPSRLFGQSKSVDCSTKGLESFAAFDRSMWFKIDSLSVFKSLDLSNVNLPQRAMSDSAMIAVLKKWKEENSGQEVENAEFIGFLKSYQKTVDKYAGLNPNIAPVISSYPALDPNARCVQRPGCTRRIIYINEGVAKYFYGIPRTMIHLLYPNELEKKTFSYNTQDQYFEQYRDTIRNEFSALVTEKYVDANLDEAALAWHFTAAVYFFIMAHETGHDVLKHFSNVKKHENADELVYSWPQELAADYYGSQINLKISHDPKEGLPLSQLTSWGCEYYCTFIDYYNFTKELDKITYEGKDQAATIADLKVMFKNYLPQISYRNLDSLVAIADKILPQNPKLTDFQQFIKKMNIPVGGDASHPPTYLRRIISRVAILRGSKTSPYVKDQQNFGDLYWNNFSKQYTMLINSIANR